MSLAVNQNNNQASGYTYDQSGKVLADASGSSYIWNAEGRMVSTAGYTYTYDGDGRRVKKAVGGHGRGDEDRGPEQDVHSPNQKLYWYGPGGQVLAESDFQLLG